MKFLKALFNIIWIISPFRIYNCILCYLATSEDGCVNISFGRVATIGDVFRGANMVRVPRHLSKYFIDKNFEQYNGLMKMYGGLPGRDDIIR